jgi:hypothetical protein
VLWLYMRHTCDFWCGEVERVEIFSPRRESDPPPESRPVGFCFRRAGKAAVQKSLAR